MSEFGSPPENQSMPDQVRASIVDAIWHFESENTEDQEYLDNVLLPELSGILKQDLSVSSNTLGLLRDKLTELDDSLLKD